MYFAVGWPKQLTDPQHDWPVLGVSCNHDRLLFAVLGQDSVSLWYCKPAVHIVCFRRSLNSVSRFGHNVGIEWKPDSSMLAVWTSAGYIHLYKVEVDMNVNNAVLYVQKEERAKSKKDNAELCGEAIPALKLRLVSEMPVGAPVTCIACLREEMMIATRDCRLTRMRWDGSINPDMMIHVSAIPFSVDLQHSRASQLDEEGVYVEQFQYSPLIGGFAIVLSNGRSAFMTANTLKFDPAQVVGVWAQEAKQATCVAVNHKYMLLAYGCTNGEGIVFTLDELTGALVVSHKLVVSSRDFPDASQVCGSVSEMKWTPDGRAVAMTWKLGGFALWSVFGTLLHCTAASSGSGISESIHSSPSMHIKSMEWGAEGYHLWVVNNKVLPSSTEEMRTQKTELLQMHFVKSALATNPCTANHGHLFLQGEDKLYLSTEESVPSFNGCAGITDCDSMPLQGNKQWQIVPLPPTYLAYNWPIRYSAVSITGHCVAIAGKTGFAHYALFTRKWKLFGNESQERDMVVTGGLTWWKDFICSACYNLLDQRDEIRFYPRDTKLDNTFAEVVRVPSQIVLLNTFHNILIVLCADCHIMIFRMERVSSQTVVSINVQKLQEVAIGSFIPHPATVITLTLTSIRTETTLVPRQQHQQHQAGSTGQSAPHEAESIILNVAGKLLMFQRDRTGPQAKHTDSKERPLPFCAPVMVASCVENVWSAPHPNSNKPHLSEALWLSCGASGMKVWLPLHLKDDGERMRGFMSKRIMLPFHVDIYPLAILFEGGILLGATTDSSGFTASSESAWPFMQLERTSHVYLHHILRQLLRRNLGVHALEIARSCTDLTYFSHVLELLLHEVLEEEATSKEPIPDPLLPRVVAFTQEFPEYLQTVVHCARKTEVALWHYLFATVGNPKDLFEQCLLGGELRTAASYLIILQNMEKAIVSRQHATLLLDASLEQCCWDLARDLVRFLKAIDPSEAESPHMTVKSRISSGSVYPSTYPTPPLSPIAADATTFAYQTQMRTRSVSVPKDDPPDAGDAKSPKGPKSKEKLRVTTSDAHLGKQKRRSPSGDKGKDDGTAEQFFIDVILNRHARKLLAAYRIKELAYFASNLEEYPLVAWLKKERIRAARVEDSVTALKKLHEDFHWPYPIMPLNSMHRMASGSSLTSTTSSFSLLDKDLNGSVEVTPTKGYPRTVLASTVRNGPLSPDGEISDLMRDIYLQPQPSMDDTSLAATEQSDNSSALEEMESGDTDSLNLAELEQLSHELANKGPAQSDLQLRYLLQVMLEACCLEWSLLLAIILRDVMAVVRTVNTASLIETPIEMVGRMREGISYLELWADTECFGYKTFLRAIQSQTQQLAKIVDQNPPTSRLSINRQVTRLSTSSNESTTGDMDRAASLTGGSEGEQTLTEHEEEDENETSGATKAEEGYECSVS